MFNFDPTIKKIYLEIQPFYVEILANKSFVSQNSLKNYILTNIASIKIVIQHTDSAVFSLPSFKNITVFINTEKYLN